MSFTGPSGTQTGRSVTVGFDATNWNTPRLLRLAANDNTAPEGVHYARITPVITAGKDAFLGLGQGDVVRGIAANINADITQTREARVMYQSADIQIFRGTINSAKSERWTVTINGESYGADFGGTATALDVARGLRDAINFDVRKPTGLTAAVIGGALRIADSAGFSAVSYTHLTLPTIYSV